MAPDRRDILEQVASGRLSPEEADELLRGLDRPEPSPEVPEGRAASDGIHTVRVRTDFGAITIVGDPDVSEAEVEGKHSARIEHGVLIVRGATWTDIDPRGPGVFAFDVRGRRRGARRVHRIKIGDFGFNRDQAPLRIRMNPDLSVDAKIDAGPLSIDGIKGRIRARSAAGPITVEGFQSPVDISVNAGAIRAVGRLHEGESRINSDAGAVRVELHPTSSVHIVAEAALGKVVLPGGSDDRRRHFGSRCEATIGSGDGELRVETAMGSIHVSTGK